jgi:hypothetical protein
MTQETLSDVSARQNGDSLTVDLSGFSGPATVIGGDNVTLQAQATEKPNEPGSKKTKILEIGDKREDGWTYVGVDNGQKIFAKGYGVMKWKEAMKFAEGQSAHLGSEGELDILQTALNEGFLKDAFDVSGSKPAGWVWGSRRVKNNPQWADGNGACVHRLSDGYRDWFLLIESASVVLFRAEPHA